MLEFHTAVMHRAALDAQLEPACHLTNPLRHVSILPLLALTPEPSRGFCRPVQLMPPCWQRVQNPCSTRWRPRWATITFASAALLGNYVAVITAIGAQLCNASV